MNTSELAKIKKHREQMLDSYCEAIKEVGGRVDYFLDEIDTMTVSEMMDALAHNDVRFTTTRRPREKSLDVPHPPEPPPTRNVRDVWF